MLKYIAKEFVALVSFTFFQGTSYYVSRYHVEDSMLKTEKIPNI